jgi:hypothetical protein
MNVRSLRCLPLLLFAMLILASPALATPISLGIWNEFGFSTVGTLATGCDPADPAGPFCIPSGGTPTSFAGAPPWTFNSAVATQLTVTDAFTIGDRFQIFDFGVSIGLTSAPVGSGDCGDDPVPCLANPNVSHALFNLAAGAHSITIIPTLAPSGGGAGYFIVNTAAAAVPEPSTWLLLGSGLITLVCVRRRSK